MWMELGGGSRAVLLCHIEGAYVAHESLDLAPRANDVFDPGI
jgi:hypothetical protein